MKKHTLIILLSIVTIIVSSQLNPLRRDTKSIEEMVLNRIPYKTGFYAAKKIIEESGWSVEYVNMKNGYALFGGNSLGTCHFLLQIKQFGDVSLSVTNLNLLQIVTQGDGSVVSVSLAFPNLRTR